VTAEKKAMLQQLMLQRLMLLSPLGERLGEAVMQEAVFALNPLS
jgi:hypothetical protein